MKCDLHSHSYYSDGTCSPEEIMQLAHDVGLSAVAITDHDTIAGLADARAAANSFGIQLINGIELSAYSDSEVHLLGYNFDINDSDFASILKDFNDKRQVRAESIIARLAQFNIKLNSQDLGDLGSVGRLHIATLLVKNGYVHSISQAFEKYLGKDGIAYSPSKRINPIEATEIITHAHGLAVLAHPLRYLQNGTLTKLIDELTSHGLAGIECYYPTHYAEATSALEDIARKHNLFATGGTDFHGANRNVKLGSVNWEISELTKSKLQLE